MRRQSIFALLVGLCIVASATSPAQAWYCSARGSTGAWGWGRGTVNYAARLMALTQCSVRTPRYARCFIQYCVP